VPGGPWRGYRDGVDAGSQVRTFEVLAWPSDRRIVLYVPEIEAATTVLTMVGAEDAARSLIADLTGLAPEEIGCRIGAGRPRP
jgi:hypothetical protein